jgi:hypothetical protein
MRNVFSFSTGRVSPLFRRAPCSNDQLWGSAAPAPTWGEGGAYVVGGSPHVGASPQSWSFRG